MPSGSTPTEEDITFHVVYMSGSVVELHPLLLTLLRWTRCRFVLVGNSLSAAEQAFLRAVAAQEPRVTVRLLATDRAPYPHYDLLVMLLRESRDEYFAFLDSDIVADGPFMPELLAELATGDAVFSGSPVSSSSRDSVVHDRAELLTGQHARNQRGDVLGGTYCAIIRRGSLERALAASSVGLRPTLWCKLSAENRRLLARHHFNYLSYDTARVVYSLMLINGAVFGWAEPPHLHHLGGYSRLISHVETPRKYFHRQQASGLRNRIGALIIKLRTSPRFCIWWYRLRFRPVRRPNEVSRSQEKLIAEYFGSLIDAHRSNQPVPAVLTIGHAEIDARIAAAAAATTAAWQPALQQTPAMNRDNQPQP